MKKYEAVIILNPNLSSKVDTFLKDFEKLLGESSFSIIKVEDIGRRQLSYSINNHNKGHYLIFNIEGDSIKLIDIENKIKYNESIIRHLFIAVKEHSGEDSQLLIDSKNKISESDDDKGKFTKEKVNTEEVKEPVKEEIEEKPVHTDEGDKKDE
ncbi:MAG: 30S ribosomal protein S6 [SAR86 cluster bacterium]|uniref:Small ribosomal subunit protein bS6 n=1 Tax=SAR86 cluster bacterium TaxID=2030880 RepID=A0A520MWU4_9GAMM|nr:MAG: 30S ribosomal protein S6 [SAR86 cluster bacterium]